MLPKLCAVFEPQKAILANSDFLFNFLNKKLRYILPVEVFHTDPFRSFGNLKTRNPML